MLPKESYRMYSPAHGGEFPVEKYLSEKTGKAVNNVYYGSGVVFDPLVVDYLKQNSFKCIWEKRHYYELDTFSITEIFELEIGDDIIIIGFSNRADDGYPGEEPDESKIAQLKNAPLKGWIQTTSPIQKVFDLLPELQSYTKKDMKGKIHLLKSTSYGFETEAFELNKPTIDLFGT